MKTLKRRKTSGEADDIVLIDVDSDLFNNLIIIDVPESLKKKRRGSGGLGKEKNYPSRTIIFIDDDENTDNQQPDIELEAGKFNPGASSSMKAGPSSSNTRRPVNGQFQFAQENISPVKLSKCKWTYSGKTSFNNFGLDSDSDSSDNDATDCEFMEDSSGKLREQWEKAKSKRKSDSCSAQSGMPNQAGASKSSTVPRQDEAPVSSCPSKESFLKDDRSPSGPTVNRSRSPSCDPMESSFADIDFNFSEKVEIHHKDADIPFRPESLRKGPSCSKAEQQNNKVFEEGGSCFFNDGQNDQAPSSSTSNPQSSRQDSYQQDDGTPQAETTSNPDPSFCHSKVRLSNDEGLHTGGCSVENNVDHGLFISRDRGKKSQHARFNSNSPFLSESKLERCSLKRNEKSDLKQPDIELESGKFNPGASSSMKAGPSSSNTRRPVNDQFQFAQENISPVKLSKCKRTYSGKTSFNNFGLDSDSDSSDNDATDCEFMEDSPVKLREQWEKAKSKRKSDSCSAQSGMPDQAGASKSSTVSRQDEAPVSSCLNKESFLKDDQSPSGPTVNRSRSPSCDPMESSFADIDFNFSEKFEIHHKDADIPLRPESLRKGPSCSKAEQQNDKVFEEGGSCFFNDGQNDQAPSSSPSNPQSSRQDSYQQDNGTPQAETASNPDPSFCHSKASLSNDKGLHTGGCSDENNVDHGLFISRDRGKKSQHARFNSNSLFLSESKLERCSLKQNEKSDLKECLHDDTPSDGKLFNPRVSPASENREALFEEVFSSEYPSLCKPGVSPESGKGDLVCKGSSFCNIHLDETQLKQRNCLEGKEACVKLASNCHEDERNDLLHGPDGDAALEVESCTYNEREKLKETDEYKRALEEEWSSRQRTLKIQAEEAQQLRRLRKRQRAESMRLLDMEKRQKQRVEEIRETQKKVEETMNLKELHRAEVRKDLYKLEITCRDMASLLRGLGIQVAGGLNPLSHEVRTAYKRALLSFHPDRASGSDMRQQVEAEEKFKLISRMKEKFSQLHDIGN